MKSLSSRMNRLAYRLAWPLLWLVLRGSERAKVFVFHNGKALVVNGWLSDGTWDLPGGGKRSGESGVQAAIRELEEEVGIQLSESDLVFVGTHAFRLNNIPSTVRYLYVELPLQPTIHKRWFEIRAFDWLSFQQLEQLDSPLVTEGLKLLKDADLIQ